MNKSSYKARRGITFDQDVSDETDTAEQVARFFLSKYKYLFKRRLAKLVFYADYRHYQENGEPLTNLNYTPTMHGMYPEAFQFILEDMDTPTSMGMQNGSIETQFKHTELPSNFSLGKEFLQTVHEETVDVTTAELCEWSKNVPMFEKTGYEEIATFTYQTVSTD